MPGDLSLRFRVFTVMVSGVVREPLELASVYGSRLKASYSGRNNTRRADTCRFLYFQGYCGCSRWRNVARGPVSCMTSDARFERGDESLKLPVLGFEAAGHGEEEMPGGHEKGLLVLEPGLNRVDRVKAGGSVVDFDVGRWEFLEEIQALGKDLDRGNLVIGQIQQEVGEDGAREGLVEACGSRMSGLRPEPSAARPRLGTRFGRA
jgi:hypothetical protein